MGTELNDEQLLRYSRHLLMPDIELNGQQQLLRSHALIIGLGGLGSPVALYLAAAGVGTLHLCDPDVVEISNLQRQIIHGMDNLGQAKVESAKLAMLRINPDINITTTAQKLEGDALDDAVSSADVVIDCSDNFTTRFTVNRSCVKTHTALVSGAVIRMEGQVSVFANRGDDTPCYECLYREQGEEDDNCTNNGVLAAAPGIIGSIQATEALKVLMNVGEPLSSRLLLMDAKTMQWREVRFKRDPDCRACGSG